MKNVLSIKSERRKERKSRASLTIILAVFVFFVLLAAILYLVFRKVEFVKNALKQLIFYLGTLFGAAAFASFIFLLASFARFAHS